jgi:AraC-like DNA-binding protein
MIRYAYELSDFRRWIGGLGKLLHLPVTGGKTEISPDYGIGYIRTGNLYAGISYLVMDLFLKDDLVLARQSSLSPGLFLLFDLETNHPAIRLCSTAVEQETTHPRNSRIKKAGIFVPHSFLRLYLQKDFLSGLLKRASHISHPYTEPIPFEYRPLLEDIFQADPSSPLHHLLLHNRFLLLAEKFLFSFIYKIPQPQPININWAKTKEKDIEALKGVMSVLCDTQLNKFPSIEKLSKTAMMSSTKLKTRFKQIYGMKLYEFYNRHRLQQAKEMLRTGNYSVKQVGVNIGFSNLSNFAKAFKKEFGVLPRQILKSK